MNARSAYINVLGQKKMFINAHLLYSLYSERVSLEHAGRSMTPHEQTQALCDWLLVVLC